MTKLEFINKVFLQWFFIRLTRCSEMVIDEIEIKEASLTAGGQMAVGYVVKLKHKIQWYSIQGWIVPTTGWSNDFKFLGRRWFKQITNKQKTHDPH